ncbi:MAG: substrate-binding domain-containing protein [Defluviitaleaceae bacterium]|nr:substrate-binding domain-containing protein [Defluviitaleaceae bacterium]
MKKILMLVVAMVAVLAFTGCGNNDQGAANGEFTIALITMDSMDQHWVTLHGGAQRAANAEGVQLNFMAPARKDDALQIEQVNNAVAAGVDAIVVAANGPDAITGALQAAADAGIVIVYVDSPANLAAEATFSTDNRQAGTTAGETMLAYLAEAGVTSGSIGIVSVNAATASTVARDEGFRAAFGGTGFTLLETQFADGDAARSQTYAQNFIVQGVVAMFGANEGSTVGIGNAIMADGGNVLGGGFDTSDAIMSLLSDGHLQFTMAQDPDNMGYMGVRAAVSALRGSSRGGAVVDTGANVIRGAGTIAATTPAEGEDFTVALITMDSMDQHWITLHGGAMRAANAEGIQLNFMAPARKDDALQIEQVNNAVAAGVDAIVVAANGPDAITGALQAAANAGILIVYVDSPANFAAEATFSTDNRQAGTTAGETMLELLAAEGVSDGSIGIVSVNAATASTVARDEGFRDAFAGTGFTLLETQFADGDAARSQTYAQNFIVQGVVAMFGANEGSTVGIGNAIMADGGNVLGGGFDTSDAIMHLLSDGHLQFTMAQDPDNMGYMGIRAAVAALRGQSPGGLVIDTGANVITG